jgi:small neutral amino acid transporter SnatA (MarC family)
MNGSLMLVAYLAALNPMRTRLGVPEHSQGRARMDLLASGSAIGLVALMALAGVASSLLSALQISPETFRIAAGLVLVIVAAWMLFVPVPSDEPVPDGPGAALWPVAYPRVISPETITLAITTGASSGVGAMLPGLVVANLVLVALGLVPTGPLGGRILANLGRVLAVALALVGIWLVLQGVREV